MLNYENSREEENTGTDGKELPAVQVKWTELLPSEIGSGSAQIQR
jgi:hypothetical protein